VSVRCSTHVLVNIVGIIQCFLRWVPRLWWNSTLCGWIFVTEVGRHEQNENSTGPGRAKGAYRLYYPSGSGIERCLPVRLNAASDHSSSCLDDTLWHNRHSLHSHNKNTHTLPHGFPVPAQRCYTVTFCIVKTRYPARVLLHPLRR
jgi:hypothetical protein